MIQEDKLKKLIEKAEEGGFITYPLPGVWKKNINVLNVV